jgi:hypothetical protein
MFLNHVKQAFEVQVVQPASRLVLDVCWLRWLFEFDIVVPRGLAVGTDIDKPPGIGGVSDTNRAAI